MTPLQLEIAKLKNEISIATCISIILQIKGSYNPSPQAIEILKKYHIYNEIMDEETPIDYRLLILDEFIIYLKDDLFFIYGVEYTKRSVNEPTTNSDKEIMTSGTYS